MPTLPSFLGLNLSSLEDMAEDEAYKAQLPCVWSGDRGDKQNLRERRVAGACKASQVWAAK